MRFFWNMSIRRKLTLIITLTCTAALLLAVVAFVAYEVHAIRRMMVEELTANAKIIGANSRAALMFEDQQAAEATLVALEAKPHVVTACLYDKTGKVFATYTRPGYRRVAFPPVANPGHRFVADILQVFEPIIQDREVVGTVFVGSNLTEIKERLRKFAGIVLGVLVVSTIVALLMSWQIQRVISRPILSLADTARRVSEGKDYTTRAAEFYQDEVGQLIRAFNEMLGQIEKSDSSLKAEIAERKAAEERLKLFADRLEASNRELQDFAYVASHDLQEPLRKIQAFGDRLKSKFGGVLGETGHDYLTRMGDAASRMQTLITDLLSFSRVTTKAQPFVSVDLNEIALGVLSDLEVRIEQTKGRVEVENLPTIDADALQMRQLFQNLIGNALKFQKNSQPPVIHVTGTVHNGSTPPRLELVFRDNGIGFDQKYAEKIFVIFQRLHGRGEYEGTGIGLAICKKIVERHGGRIEAISTPGEGATFSITLPVNQHNGEE